MRCLSVGLIPGLTAVTGLASAAVAECTNLAVLELQQVFPSGGQIGLNDLNA